MKLRKSTVKNSALSKKNQRLTSKPPNKKKAQQADSPSRSLTQRGKRNHEEKKARTRKDENPGSSKKMKVQFVDEAATESKKHPQEPSKKTRKDEDSKESSSNSEDEEDDSDSNSSLDEDDSDTEMSESEDEEDRRITKNKQGSLEQVEKEALKRGKYLLRRKGRDANQYEKKEEKLHQEEVQLPIEIVKPKMVPRPLEIDPEGIYCGILSKEMEDKVTQMVLKWNLARYFTAKYAKRVQGQTMSKWEKVGLHNIVADLEVAFQSDCVH